MHRFGLSQIYYSEVGVGLVSTDPELVAALISVLSASYPSHKRKDLATFAEGQPHRCLFQGFQGHDRDVAWWLAARMGDDGWEPFSIDFEGPPAAIWLRKEYPEIQP